MINREMLMDLTRVKLDFEKFKSGLAASHDYHVSSQGVYDVPLNISVASPGPGSQAASINNGRITPGSGLAPGDENNFLTSVSRHFDSLAVDSVLKAPSTNKPQTQGQTRRNNNLNDMTA